MTSDLGPLAPIRIDPDSGYICISDIYERYVEGDHVFRRWMSDTNSILFFEAWEIASNPSILPDAFLQFLLDSSSNTYRLTPTMLEDAGATGIFVHQSQKPEIYVHPDWVTHFGNWLNPEFYVKTLAILRESSGITQSNVSMLKALDQILVDKLEE